MLGMNVKATGTVSDPPDFGEGGREYRRNILASTSLVFVLLLSSPFQPELFSIKVPVTVMWAFLAISHMYFFLMWRLTAPIESDVEKRFLNLEGLFRQALLGGTKGFPGKTKAQIILIRALPIWAFTVGLFGIFYGLCSSG
jgi:hypothetical protein